MTDRALDADTGRVRPLGDIPGGWWAQMRANSPLIEAAMRKRARKRNLSVKTGKTWRL